MPTGIRPDSVSLLCPKEFELLEPKKEFEDDPGINIGHITVCHNGFVFLLSGFNGYKENSTAFYRPSDEIWVYDQIVEKWIKRACTGESGEDDLPLERSSACGTIIEDHLYLFGGFSEEGNLNTLFRLNLNTLKWRQLYPEGREPLRCDKNVCWEHDGRLYLFAGYGPVPRFWSEEFRFQFVADNTSQWHYIRGWNNQLVCYDPTSNTWQWPVTTGKAPSARAACATAKIGDYVYIFGGRVNQERMNDLYVLDMNTMNWSELYPNNKQHAVRGRSWHTLTVLSPRTLVLYGGFSHDNKPLNDCWLFDIFTCQWRQVELPFDKPRFWHSATLNTHGEILILGGAIEELAKLGTPKQNHMFAKDMFAIQFQPKSLLRLCLNSISSRAGMLKPYWNTLPLNLQEILYRRCSSNSVSKLKRSYSETDEPMIFSEAD